MSEEKEERLVFTDEDGWKCRLERWHSPYEDEWYTAVTVFDAEGKEVLHSGMGNADMTEESAMKSISVARGLLECGNILQRRKETE